MPSPILQIPNSGHPHFGACMEIYAEAFPPAERQPVELIRHRVDTGLCELYCYLDEGAAPVGMAVVWTFGRGRIMLLDYMAMAAAARGRGYGRLLLQAIARMAADRQMVLGLEIEHPEHGENAAQRRARMDFYLSNGARVLANVPYRMPALTGGDALEMLLLVHAPEVHGLEPDDIRDFISDIYRYVYELEADHPLRLSVIEAVPEVIEVRDGV